jgi:S-adenosylmethionine hydrolase
VPPTITFLTDFGITDTYVGQVKGAILALTPDAHVVDLTHAIPPQDVAAGAFLLWSSVAVFAPGTVHLAVVDPGVGSARRAVAIQTGRGDLLVGPDNGLLLPAANRLGGVARAVDLRNPAYWRPTLSPTFHGRDLFGPAAAHLARGVPLETLGPSVVDLQRPIDFAPPRAEPGRLVGTVLHVDTYGNLVTSIPAADLPACFSVEVGSSRIEGAPHANYQSVAPGELLALEGSSELQDVSARDPSAAVVTAARRGTPIVVIPADARDN